MKGLRADRFGLSRQQLRRALHSRAIMRALSFGRQAGELLVLPGRMT
ncbi:hypothetical protein [Streptomyces parvus]|nr:hypothetical protein [Streptomyces parvus]